MPSILLPLWQLGVGRNVNFVLDRTLTLWQPKFMTMHPLAQYRQDKELTQDALAELLGVTKSAISRWESGERTPRNELIPLIAEKTGISPSQLRPDLAELLKDGAG